MSLSRQHYLGEFTCALTSRAEVWTGFLMRKMKSLQEHGQTQSGSKIFLNYMSYSLNSSEGASIGGYKGEYSRDIDGDTRSLG